MAPAGEVAVDISGVLAHRIIYLWNRPVVPDYIDWQFFKTELVQSKGANVQWLTSSSLTKRDGDLTIVINWYSIPPAHPSTSIESHIL